MANVNNVGQQSGGQQDQAQAAGGVGGVAAGGNPPPPAFDPQRARHEAAHAVVIDDIGYHVLRVNINPIALGGGHQPQLTQADWGAFQADIAAMDWDDAAKRDAIRPRIIDYVKMLVAGHLAENLQNGAIERVSTRLQNNPGLLQNPPNLQNAVADRDRTALYLFLVQRNTLADVIAAEGSAEEILTRRADHLDALTDLLIQHGTVEGDLLDDTLNYEEA